MKSKELVNKFEEQIGCSALNVDYQYHCLDEETKELAKQCALICVDFTLSIGVSPLDTKRLKQLKQEINKL